MNSTERRAVISISLIMSFRMLGLFMIIPVFSIYAQHLDGQTAALIGIALGIYGLTQAGLQIPFGMLSDRVGRKPIITLGLLLFAIGGVISALAHSIIAIIIGRAIQGMGAIGSTSIALLSDVTQDDQRTKAMAILGLVIGLSFFVAIILGPIIDSFWSVPGIFWLSTLLALLAIPILLKIVPTASEPSHSHVPLLSILRDKTLLLLDLGVFLLHALFTASFVIIPIIIQNIGIESNQQWMLYFLVLIAAFLCVLPLIFLSEKKRMMPILFMASIITIGVSQIIFWRFNQSMHNIIIGLFLFFTAFSFLEASLPSLVSKLAPPSSKGTAMGVYSTAQFLGIFAGGALGGWLYGWLAQV